MRGKLQNIEALRGLASLSVVWFHATNGFTGLARSSGYYCWLGVEAFFVISGFIIPYALHAASYTPRQFPQFMGRRLVRLEPPYLASIALIIGLAALQGMLPGFQGHLEQFTPLRVATHLFYVAPLFHQEWINVVYWTLVYEFIFYICAGLAAPSLFKKHLAFTVVLVAAIALLAAPATAFINVLVLLFLIGMATMRFVVGRDSLAVFLTCLAATGALMTAADGLPQALVGIATALVIAFVKSPKLGVLAPLGAISYSLYLVHTPIGGRVINFGVRFGSGEIYNFALAIGATLISIVAAIVFYWLIERPATKAAQRLSLRSRQKPGPLPEAQAS